MADSKFGLPNLKIGAQTWNSKFGLPNLKIGQIPSFSTAYTPICYFCAYPSIWVYRFNRVICICIAKTQNFSLSVAKTPHDARSN